MRTIYRTINELIDLKEADPQGWREKTNGFLARIRAEAAELDAKNIHTPWQQLQWTIGTMTIEQMRVAALPDLCLAGSPYIVGGRLTPGAAAALLYRCSTMYVRYDLMARDDAIRILRAYANDDDIMTTAQEVVDEAFGIEPQWPTPPRNQADGDTKRMPIVANIVHTLAQSYGWGLNDILELPVSLALQLHECIARSVSEDNISRPHREAAQAWFMEIVNS